MPLAIILISEKAQVPYICLIGRPMGAILAADDSLSRKFITSVLGEIMSRGKPVLPEKLRQIALCAFRGESTYRNIALRFGTSSTDVGRLMARLSACKIFTIDDLAEIDDNALFKLRYPNGRLIYDSNGQIIGSQISRGNPENKLIPNFEELAHKVIDEKVKRIVLLTDYQRRYTLAGKESISTKAFYKGLKNAITEMTRGNDAVMLIDRQYGDEVQVDFAGTTATLPMADGTPVKLTVFAMCWPASGYVWACFVERQTAVDVCRAIGRAFKAAGVLPKVITVDNAKCMVIKHQMGKEAILNSVFDNFVSDLGVSVHACNPYSPTSKSQVEYANRLITERVLPQLSINIPKTKVAWDIELQQLIDRYINDVAYKRGPMSRTERFERFEKSCSRPLLHSIEEIPQIKECKVPRNYHVNVEGHLYSVPYKYINQNVRIKYTDSRVVIYCAGQEIACHARCFAKNAHTTVPAHMPPAHCAVLENTHKYRNDDDILNQAKKLSSWIYQYCDWRLKHKDGQRYKSCISVINFYQRANCPTGVDLALQVMMSDPIARRNYYTLEALYKKIMATKATPMPPLSDSSKSPGIIEVSERQEKSSQSVKQHDDEDAYISDFGWFKDETNSGDAQ